MSYDVIVIGAGHAGIEASLASARMGAKTLLITILVEQIGTASCNPAIGGLAKGHLVKEIDALGGEMGKITDKSGIQFRILNASKGPAVRGSRAQIDMDRYRIAIRDVVLNTPNLDVTQEMANELLVREGKVVGVKTNLNSYETKKVIVTTGTFLNGVVHIGEYQESAGRVGEFASTHLSNSLSSLGLTMGRLKTGTCARVDGKSIDFSQLEEQGGDEKPEPFSFSTKTFNPTQLPCYVAYTNLDTHTLIENNFDRAPLFSGQIEGVGPRYCPSIEDKIYRFKDRERHQIFVEPQTTEANEFYLNGLSTSLPTDVQYAMIRSIKGFEQAKIVRFGYAIEYDYVDPTELYHSLETKKIPNLYLAGQINATTGYEEAGAQGLMAGINAVLAIQGEEPFILRRDESYIGVLIDDLVTKGTSEPYRMFTSRAEYRLLLRESNAHLRLSKYGYNFGLIKDSFWRYVQELQTQISEAIGYMESESVTPTKELIALLESLGEEKINDKTELIKVIGRSSVSIQKMLALIPDFEKYSQEALREILIEAKYYQYIKKQHAQIESMKDMLGVKIPKELDLSSISGLSNEIKEKLEKFKPDTLFSASQISGVTPSAIEIIHIYIKMFEKGKL